MLNPGRPFSQLNQVNDLRGDDFVPLLRTSEPLPDDQNVIISGQRLEELLGDGSGGGGGGTVPYPLYAGPGTHTDGPMHQLAATLLANRSPNLTPGNVKQARFYSNADRTAFGPLEEGVTAEEEFARHATAPLNLGMFFTVELPVNKLYYIAYDDGTNTTVPAGLRRTVFRTGDQEPNDFANGMLVEWGSPEAAAANIPLLDPSRTDYPFPFTVKRPIGGTVYFFGTAAPGGPFPAPTTTAGTADWKPESAPIPTADSFQDITQAQGIALLDDRQVRRNRLYKVTFPPRATPTIRPETVVYLVGMDEATFSGPGQLVDPSNPERTVPVTVDVRTGTIVDIQARLEALAAPITQRDFNDVFSGESSLVAAATWLGDDRALLLNSPVFELTQDVYFSQGIVRGNGSRIQAGLGVLFSVGGTAFFDATIAVSALTISGSDTLFSGGQTFAQAIHFAGPGTLTLRDVPANILNAVTIDAGVTGCVIILQNNTTWPVGLTLPAGVMIDDQRGSFKTSPDGTQWRIIINNAGVVGATTL